jgi:Ca2+-binding EF-hand superfamily protein
MKKLMFGALAAAVLSVPAGAQLAPQGMTRAEMEARVRANFGRVDANRDGYVTREEAQAVRRSVRTERRGDRQAGREAAFARLDANRDGSISRTEFLERRQTAERGDRRARRAERRAERREWLVARRQGGMRLGGRVFERIDADRDGRVSLAEATTARLRLFERLDANRDGRVTREERRQARAARG